MFGVLFRAFVSRFFSSESVTSDVRLRETQIWILVGLMTPGVAIAMQAVTWYGYAVYYQPALVDVLTAALAVVFVTYAGMAVGLVAVVEWNALAFDRRDAMVLGPLPVRGVTVMSAKLAALGTLLLGTSVAMNLSGAVLIALVASSRLGL